jgi:hypothetical protein
MRAWVKAIPLGVALPVAIMVASVKPEDAASNVSAWVQFVGFEHVPSWLNAPGIDTKVFWGAVVAAGIYALVAWGPPIIKPKKSKDEVLAPPKSLAIFSDPVPEDYQEPDQSPPAPYMDSKGRVVVGVSPKFLTSLYEQHMAIQSDRLAAAYIGKWMKITGRLKNVSMIGQSLMSVSFWEDTMVIIMYFDLAWSERLTVLIRGQTISVMGKIEKINQSDLQLTDCELIDDPSA